MISAVSFERLSLIRLGKDQYGKRKYLTQIIDKIDLEAIQKGILASLGLFN
jgi:mRNA interferase MazF